MIVRCILLRNIMRGRVARHLARQGRSVLAGDMQAWLGRYARVLASWYQAEHEAWVCTRRKENYPQLGAKLMLFARGQCKLLNESGASLDADEVANEAFVHCQERLDRYPFDLPLDEWLDRHVRQCADRLCRPTRSWSEVPLDSLAEELLPAPGPLNMDSWHDEWIDLVQSTESLGLSESNKLVLQMWYHGYSLEETSRTLDLQVKAVSKRRRRIARQLGGGFARCKLVAS